MNKQFDKLLEGCPGCPLYLSDSEQQVWLAAQKAMLEVGYRKPHPPVEGELVDCPNFDTCTYKACVSCEVYDAIKAQLAHDKTTRVPISELRAIIQEASNKPRYFIAVENKLLKLLGEKP